MALLGRFRATQARSYPVSSRQDRNLYRVWVAEGARCGVLGRRFVIENALKGPDWPQKAFYNGSLKLIFLYSPWAHFDALLWCGKPIGVTSRNIKCVVNVMAQCYGLRRPWLNLYWLQRLVLVGNAESWSKYCARSKILCNQFGVVRFRRTWLVSIWLWSGNRHWHPETCGWKLSFSESFRWKCWCSLYKWNLCQQVCWTWTQHENYKSCTWDNTVNKGNVYSLTPSLEVQYSVLDSTVLTRPAVDVPDVG